MSTEMPLAGKTAVVTGVGRGIGQATVAAFSMQGALVLGCDVDDTSGSSTMQGVGPFLHADVSREGDVEQVVAQAIAEFDHLDIMVNNAAIPLYKPLTETTESELDRVLEVNVKGVFFGCKHAVGAMQKSGGGAIVNVASVMSLSAMVPMTAYCASKAAVLGLTRACALECGPLGIRCTAVCPGDVDTPVLQPWFDEAADPIASKAEIDAKYPRGRMGTSSEIAQTIAFLASDAASFITGYPVVADGGRLSSYY